MGPQARGDGSGLHTPTSRSSSKPKPRPRDPSPSGPRDPSLEARWGPPLAPLLLLRKAGTLCGVRRPPDGAGVGVVGKGLGAEAPAEVVKSMTDALVRRREGEGQKPRRAPVAGAVPLVRPRPRPRELLRRAAGREGERPGRQRAERCDRAVSLASHSGCGAGGRERHKAV